MTRDVAASVRARLLNQARAAREEFERTLVRYADERFLYRLGASPARDRCILKGASLLSVWMRDPYRATRDVDLLATEAMDDGMIRRTLEQACAVGCVEDGLVFDLAGLQIDDIRALDNYPGRRARFAARLGAARIHLQVDFGSGDALVQPANELEYPSMLPDVPPARVRAYPMEATIAEKMEAMVALDVQNTRMKDFHDVWALSGAFTFVGAGLHAAVAACFERRRRSWSDEVPRVLTSAFYQMPELQARWSHYLAADAVIVAPPARFEIIGERVIQFLGPIRLSIVSEGRASGLWAPGGPWRPSGSASLEIQ